MNLWMYAAVGLVLLAVFAVFLIGIVVGWKLTHPKRKPVEMRPERYGIDRYEDVAFESREPGVLLSGWYLSAAANGADDNGCTLIFAHGYSQNRQEPHLPALSLAARMVAAGFDVLMFDFRNAGLSGGRHTTVGWKEQEDLLGAVDYVKERYPDRRIALVGFSMGAATSLLAAAREPEVQAVVADSPFASLPAYLRENLPRFTGLPAFPFNWIILTCVPLLVNATPRRVRPDQAVSRIAPRPVLFIHGMADETTPYENSVRLYALADNPRAELWLVPGVGHVRSYASCPDEYADRLLRFFAAHLLQRQETQTAP